MDIHHSKPLNKGHVWNIERPYLEVSFIYLEQNQVSFFITRCPFSTFNCILRLTFSTLSCSKMASLASLSWCHSFSSGSLSFSNVSCCPDVIPKTHCSKRSAPTLARIFFPLNNKI